MRQLFADLVLGPLEVNSHACVLPLEAFGHYGNFRSDVSGSLCLYGANLSNRGQNCRFKLNEFLSDVKENGRWGPEV